MTCHEIHLNMCQYSAALIKLNPGTGRMDPDHHRGIWLMSPDDFCWEPIIGDEVHFIHGGVIRAKGRITGFLSFDRVCELLGKKPCSAVNSVCITWEDLP